MNALPRRPPFAVALLALALMPAAVAQTPTRDKPFPVIQDARAWGPFQVDLGLTLENFGYDDNIYLAPSSSGLPKIGDWVLKLAPEIKAQTTFGHNIALTLRDRVAGEVFLDNSDLNHLDNEAEGQLDVLLGPVLLTTRGRYATQEWRPTSEFRNRVEQRDGLVAQGLRLFLGPRTDVFAEYMLSRFKYQDPGTGYAIDDDLDGTLEIVPIEVVLDREQERLRAEFGWRATGATRIFVRAQRTTAEFENRIRDSEELRGMIGFEFSPSSKLSGRFAYGRSRLEEIDEVRGLEPYDGPVAEALLTLRPTGASRFTLRWDRQLFFSTFESNLYFVSNSRGLSFDWYLGSAWGVQAGYTLIDDDYPEPGTFGAQTGVRRADEIEEWYGGILYRTRGGIELGLRYGERVRTSNYPGVDDDQRYFTTTGRYAF